MRTMRSKLVLILFLVLATGCASAGVNITAYTPLDPTPVVYSSINFTANFSEEGFFEWLVDGSVVQNGTADNTTYTFSVMLINDFNITIRTADAQHSWALKAYEEGTQVVTMYTPASSTPSATSGTVVEFTANLSEPGFYEWLVNDTVVQNGTAAWGNLSTSYNYTASSIGVFNVTIRPENDQQEWLLTVTSVVLDNAIHAGYWQKWTGTGWNFVNTTPTTNSASLAGQLEVTVS